MCVLAIYVQRKEDGYTVAHWEQPWFAPSESKHLAWRIASYLDPRNLHEPSTSKLEKLIEEQGSADYGLEHLNAAAAGISAWSSGGYYQLSGRRLAGSYPTQWFAPLELAVSENLGLNGPDPETGNPIVTALRVCVVWKQADDLQASVTAYDTLHRTAELVRRYDRLFRNDNMTGSDTGERAATEEELSTMELAQRCRLNLMLYYCMLGIDIADVEKWVQSAPLCREYDSKAMNAWRSLWEQKEQLRERALAAGVFAVSDLKTDADVPQQKPKDDSKEAEKERKKKQGKGKHRKRVNRPKTAPEIRSAKERDPLESLVFTRAAFNSPELMRRARRAFMETLFGAVDTSDDDWLEDFAYAKDLDVPAVEATMDDWLAMLDARLAEEQATADAAAATKRLNLWLVDDDFLDQHSELAAELFERAPYFDGARLLQRTYDESFCERAYTYFKAVFYLLERGHFKDGLVVLQDNIMAGMVRKTVRPRDSAAERKAANPLGPAGSEATAHAQRDATSPRSGVLSKRGDSSMISVAVTNQHRMQISERSTVAQLEQAPTHPLVEEVDEDLDVMYAAPDRATTATAVTDAIVEVLVDEHEESSVRAVEEGSNRQTISTDDVQHFTAVTEAMGSPSQESTAQEMSVHGPGNFSEDAASAADHAPDGTKQRQQAQADSPSTADPNVVEPTPAQPEPETYSEAAENPADDAVSTDDAQSASDGKPAAAPKAEQDMGADHHSSEKFLHSHGTSQARTTEDPDRADPDQVTSIQWFVQGPTDQMDSAAGHPSIAKQTGQHSEMQSDLGEKPQPQPSIETMAVSKKEVTGASTDDLETITMGSVVSENLSLRPVAPRWISTTIASTTRFGESTSESLPEEQPWEGAAVSASAAPPASDGPEPSAEDKRLYLLGCWYKLALHILDRITALDRTASATHPTTRQRPGGYLSPEDERAQAHLSNLLAYLPLLPRHRQAAVNVSIEKNMQLGNYGYATGWIDWAYDRFSAGNMDATRARYDRLLDECEDAAWQNEYVVPELDRLMEYYGRGSLKLREYLLLAQEEVSGLWNPPRQDDASSDTTTATSEETTSEPDTEDFEGLVLDDTSNDGE
jgi:hypothetical protein